MNAGNVGGSAFFYAPPGPGRVEPTGYFDPVYLPTGSQHSAGLGPSGLANEILEEENESAAEEQDSGEVDGAGAGKEAGEGTPSTDGSRETDDAIGRSTSQDSTGTKASTFSEATSWYNSEESGDERTNWDGRRSGAVGSSVSLAVSNSTDSGSGIGSANGSGTGSGLGVGILGEGRKTISRTHSMSGGPKPLFLNAYKPDSDPPTRATSSGHDEPMSTTATSRVFPNAIPGWPVSFGPLTTQLKGKEQQKRGE